jgi:hypothetical protein
VDRLILEVEVDIGEQLRVKLRHVESGEIEGDRRRLNVGRDGDGELRGLTINGGECLGRESECLGGEGGEELLPGEIGELIWVGGEPGGVTRARGVWGGSRLPSSSATVGAACFGHVAMHLLTVTREAAWVACRE